MDWTQISLETFIPELPKNWNSNFEAFKRYMDVFYDENRKILIKPLETTGKVKGATGEFVTAVVDNLVVKNQFTNLYGNITTADYQYYTMLVDTAVVPRDPCTFGIDTSVWTFPYESSAYQVIDVNKPYYKLTNGIPIQLNNLNLSQIVGFYLDPSIIGSANWEILLDPCLGTLFIADPSSAGAYIEFIASAFDASWGSTWVEYKSQAADDSGFGTGTVGPGTLNYLSLFTAPTTVGDSLLFMDGNTLNTLDISTLGVLSVDGSIYLNGVEVGVGFVKEASLGDQFVWDPSGFLGVDVSLLTVYDPTLPDDLLMPYSVGGIPYDTSVGGLRGKTFEQLFNDLLFPTVLASIFTTRSLGFTSGSPSGLAEPSTMYSPTITANYITGVIHNGDGTTNPNPLTGDAYYFKFKLPSGAIDFEEAYTGNSRARTFTPIYVGNAGTTNTWSVDVSYNAGTGTYTDNKGNIGTNLDAQRVAALISANSSTVTVRNKRFWGVNASGSLSSAQIQALSNEFLSSTPGTYAKSDFVLNPSNEYVYYCYPATIGGTPTFWLNSLQISAIHNIGPISFTNAYGHTESYNVYRSDTVQTGTGQTWKVT